MLHGPSTCSFIPWPPSSTKVPLVLPVYGRVAASISCGIHTRVVIDIVCYRPAASSEMQMWRRSGAHLICLECMPCIRVHTNRARYEWRTVSSVGVASVAIDIHAVRWPRWELINARMLTPSIALQVQQLTETRNAIVPTTYILQTVKSITYFLSIYLDD